MELRCVGRQDTLLLQCLFGEARDGQACLFATETGVQRRQLLASVLAKMYLHLLIFYCNLIVSYRTYEIQLHGGTPFDTGVDLDPSVSLKGNDQLCYANES